MAECPNCGTEVSEPRKTWNMAGRADRQGMKTQLTIGLFDCPTCKKTFRKVLKKKKIPA